MKVNFLVLAFVFGILSAYSQTISKNAIGIRFGNNNGYGAEISYQRKLKTSNRFEGNIGIRGSSFYNSSSSSFKTTGFFQWLFPIPEIDKNVNWYAGFGSGFGGTFNSYNYNSSYNSSSFYLFASGVIGIEYNFKFPLLISLDYRPEFGFNKYYNGFNSDIGLGLRYQF